MDARGKIVAALLIFVSFFFARHAFPLILSAAILFAVAILERLLKPWLRAIIVLLPVIALVGVMDVAYSGLAYGSMVCLRFVLTVSLFTLFFRTSGLEDLSAALSSWYLPYPLIFALITGARFGPTVSLDARDIMEAYRARGVDRNAGLIGWFRRYGRILIPLVAATIRRSLRLGEAMEMRGFGTCSQPTIMRDPVCVGGTRSSS
jgi:energy-coupling factor transporter transmembrane protein EcfT